MFLDVSGVFLRLRREAQRRLPSLFEFDQTEEPPLTLNRIAGLLDGDPCGLKAVATAGQVWAAKKMLAPGRPGCGERGRGRGCGRSRRGARWRTWRGDRGRGPKGASEFASLGAACGAVVKRVTYAACAAQVQHGGTARYLLKVLLIAVSLGIMVLAVAAEEALAGEAALVDELEAPRGRIRRDDGDIEVDQVAVVRQAARR